MEKEVFDELRAIIYSKSGISISENKTALMSSRVNRRLRALNLESYRDYLEHLRRDPEETVHFLDVISTNTTGFFREPVHFEVLSGALSEWSGKGQGRFRIWCAASSSGEEPYTLAMTALEALKGRGSDVKILATDISTKILAFAKEGLYGEERLKGVPQRLLERYFVRVEGDESVSYKAGDALRAMIVFKRLNLSSPPFPMKGPLDVVFCRNVMIYFDNPVRQRLVDDIARLLRPGGYLMVGHSESLAGIKTPLKAIRPAVYLKSQ